MTPVVMKPMMAGVKLVPDCAPRMAGKIRFPAPKNMENSMRAVTMVPVRCDAPLGVVVIVSSLACVWKNVV